MGVTLFKANRAGYKGDCRPLAVSFDEKSLVDTRKISRAVLRSGIHPRNDKYATVAVSLETCRSRYIATLFFAA